MNDDKYDERKEHDGGSFTPRGFEDLCCVIDRYDQSVIVRESSLATEPCVWIMCKDTDGHGAIVHMGNPQARSPHLTPKQALRVAAALVRFAIKNDGWNASEEDNE